MAAKKTTKNVKASKAPQKVEAPKTTPTPKKDRGGPRGPRAGSKTSFILTQPADMLAKDVVAAGAKAGFEFSDKFVWSVRSAEKAKGANGRATSKPTSAEPTNQSKPVGRPKKAASPSVTLGPGGSLEEQLFSLALEVGIARAEAIVRRARQQIDGLRL